MAYSEALILTICTLVLVSATVVYQCTDDIFADPDSCDHFYKCDNGKPVLFNCPDNLFYNTKSKVCDWPANVECDVNTGERPCSTTCSSGSSGSSETSGSKDCSGSKDSSGYEDSANDQSSEYDETQFNNDVGNQATTQNGDQASSDKNEYYPVHNVDAQDPDVAPSVQEPAGTDFSERPRRTVDDQLTDDNNPYEDAEEYQRSDNNGY